MDDNAVATSIVLLLVFVAIILSHYLGCTNYKYATEGSIALILGLGAGGLYYLVTFILRRGDVHHKLIEFNEDLFFQVLLPPIIFNAGFSVKKKLFFRNFLTLMVLGVFGTMIISILIAFGGLKVMSALGLPQHGLWTTALAIGCILSPSDTVSTLQIIDKDQHPVLYSLVFGEGIVNDATAIVLLGAAESLALTTAFNISAVMALLGTFLRLFTLSLALGIGVGLISALTVRWVFRTHAANREVMVVGVLGMMAYYLAEAANLSPIIAVFFCGITSSHYTWHSMNTAAQIITRHGFATISSFCELTLFVYSGLDSWSFALSSSGQAGDETTTWQTVFHIVSLSLGLVLLVVLSRGIVTSSVVALANVLWRRREPFTVAEGVVIWWGGLPRGAISLALAYHFFSLNPDPEDRIVEAAIVGVVLLTTVGFGVVTDPIMSRLLVRPEPSDFSELHLVMPLLPDGTPAPGELFHGLLPQATLQEEMETRTWVHWKWRAFDARFMQPLFGGRQDPRRSSHGPGRPLVQRQASHEHAQVPQHENGHARMHSAFEEYVHDQVVLTPQMQRAIMGPQDPFAPEAQRD